MRLSEQNYLYNSNEMEIRKGPDMVGGTLESFARRVTGNH